MRADFHPEALDEAAEARQRYVRISPHLGRRFQVELEHATDQIESAPLRWPPYLHGTRVLKLDRYPYHVIYRHRPTEILVVAIAHAKRRPGYWKARLR